MSELKNSIYSTVRIISHTEVYDIFNPSSIENYGQGIGSGFFIDDMGHILTCYHVIQNSAKLFINIPITGKKQYNADIISVYPDMDIAVIKIHNFKNTNYLRLDTLDNIDMGNETIALGYPLGESTIKITKGIISGVKKHLLQTDTAINSGNSGGPLLNSNYDVIGINSSKVAESSVEGVGYSIPINIFKKLKQHFMINQKDSKVNMLYEPNLYCKIQTLEDNTVSIFCSKFMAKYPKVKIEGVIISSIYKNSPFMFADTPLEKYDILMEFDNLVIDAYGDVKVSWSMGKIGIKDLIKRYSFDKKISIKFLSLKTQEIVNTYITFKNTSYYGINELYYPNKIEYVNFKDMIICQLTLNHISDILNGYNNMGIINKTYISNFVQDENREKPRIIIGKVLPKSEMINIKNISKCIGMVINRVNGKYIYTINEFNDICNNTDIIINNKKYIHFEMFNREHITICMD